MSAEHEKLKEVFAAALAISSAEEREKFLVEACANDPELRHQVASLLQAHDLAGNFLQANAISAPPAPAEAEGPGSVVGRYRLVERIGEGGFGVVFRAEQLEPIRRQVALKIIKAGMDTREVIARFEAERQALALMDHPNIARVLDAGSTGVRGSQISNFKFQTAEGTGESGISNLKSQISSRRPYFVMELVEGIPITDFCDQHRLPTEARLRLFLEVCAGIQHAHLKGIIHRDLKPTNILVTLPNPGSAGVPKVIDFGIAKAMDRKLTDQTVFTRREELIGTPAYMSPEQAEHSALDVDTRTDIYSLGVLLYELLTGSTPFDTKALLQSGLDELRRTIREKEPMRPSTRLRQTSVARSPSAPATLPASLATDLDWIVMKALEKDRDRRYETVSALARDVERHLNGEPVAARPPSATYRAGKFIRRHRVGVLATVGVALALVVGLVLALLGFTQARRSGQQATQMAATAQAINDFLQQDLLSQASPENTTNRNITLREAVDRAAARIRGRFVNQPLVEAAIQMTLGSLYTWLEEYSAAEPHARRAVELRQRVLGLEHAETLAALTQLAVILANEGRRSEGAGLMRGIAKTGERTLNLAHPKDLECLHFVGQYWQLWARPEEADVLLHGLLDKEQRLWTPSDWHVLQTETRLADLCAVLRRFSECAALSEAVLGIERRNPGWHTPQVLQTAGNAQFGLGDYPKAAECWKESLELARQRWGPDTELVLQAMSSLSSCYGAMGQWRDCAALEREIVRSAKNPEILATAGLYGSVAAVLDGNTNVYREFAARQLSIFGRATNAAWARIVGEVCLLQPDSVPDLQPVLQLLQRVPPGRVWDLVAKGLAAYRRGDLDGALKLLEAPRQSTGALASQAGYICAMIHHRRGDSVTAQGDLQEANQRLSAVLSTGELGEAWHEYGRAAVARAEAEQLIFGRQVTPYVDAPSLTAARQRWAPVRGHLNTADRLAAQKRWPEAAAEYSKALGEPVFDWRGILGSEAYLAARIGIVFLLARDNRQYERHCRGLLARLEAWPDTNLAYHLLKAILAHDLPKDEAFRAQAAKWLSVFQGSSQQGPTEGVGLVPAMAAYRWGRYEAAVNASRAEDKSRLALRSGAIIYRAMALAKLGRTAEAQRELNEVQARLAPHLINLTGDFWWDLGLCQLALDEAHRLIRE